jgi:hypothetical protein
MKPSQREKWARIREQGKVRYVLINGLIYQGIPFAVMMLLADYFFDDRIRTLLGLKVKPPDDLAPDWFIWVRVYLTIGKFLLLAVGFGTWMGWWTWYWGERSYQKTMDSEKYG